MKTACIFHSVDLDGWMSAAIVKHWWHLNNEGVFYDNPYVGDCSIVAGKENETSLTMIGFNYGNEVPNLSKYDKVIICDISFPKEEMRKLFEQHINSFVWLDHHISAIKEVGRIVPMEFTEDISVKHAACELTWKYFFPNETMPEIVRLLGRYDCFGHKGTPEEKKVLEFQYGARQCISNYEEAYQYLELAINPKKGDATGIILENGKSIYQYLCTEAKQVYKNGFEINLYEPIDLSKDESLNYPRRKFICINKERFNPINFGIEYHKDGYDGAACFHYANGKWNFSIYNDNGMVDCSAIAKSFGGGGHKGASGFIVPDINEFLNSVKC